MRTRCLVPVRRFSSSSQYFGQRNKCNNYNFFATTPIFYVNASPHLGHLYSAVVADAAQRFQRLLLGGQSLFSSGTDEHGSKVETAAGCSNPQSYCDNVSSQYQKMLELYDVDCTDFIRTTSSEHKTSVNVLWGLLQSRGYLYQGEYSGWYCVADEAFVPESRVLTSPDSASLDKVRVSADSGRPVEWTCENNYMFRLSSCKDDLLHWLSNEKVVQPSKFHRLLMSWIHEGLCDVSISRPASRVPWGIPVPNDPSHTVYVWLDALANYLTAAGFPGTKLKRWPPDLHVLGKDILRFHGLLWPSLLLAAGLEPPRQLLCHSHWMVDGEKMSKSKGNVVNPLSNQAQTLTTSGLRYFLLREGVAHSDGNYNEEKARRILNAELADKLGNLLNRCTGLALNPKQVWPSFCEDQENILIDVAAPLVEAVSNLPNTAQEHFEDHNFYKVVDAVVAVLQEANRFFESQKPWELPRDGHQLGAILSLTMETLRVCGIILQPVIPRLSSSLLDKLKVPEDQRLWKHLQEFNWKSLPTREKMINSEKVVLFQRLDTCVK